MKTLLACVVVIGKGTNRVPLAFTVRRTDRAAWDAYMEKHPGLHPDETDTDPRLYACRVIVGRPVRLVPAHVVRERERKARRREIAR